MPGPARPGHATGMANPVRHHNTAAFRAQAYISFGVSLAAMGTGIAYLHTDAWIRAFLALALLYVVTSSLTLAKVVRDRQEEEQVATRVDAARLDKLLAEHDPFRVDAP
jgi:hypothetical protein